MLNSVELHDDPGIQRAFLMDHDKIQVVITPSGSIEARSKMEWVLETHGVNLRTVTRIEDVDFSWTCSNSLVEIFDGVFGLPFPSPLTPRFGPSPRLVSPLESSKE